MSADTTARKQYRITWTFPNGRKLVRLIHFQSSIQAEHTCAAPDFYREIFRRAGLAYRTASAFEYLDHFPTPSGVTVTPSGF
jgi:hypothetical protein